ncbi:MAG: hypothetical protein HC910_16430 [Spirulinaceae cyanobacterium SM2_1_0]|nr:hypothetical protein [Spirulinaceae cyanobacterium SM2_1_0]
MSALITQNSELKIPRSGTRAITHRPKMASTVKMSCIWGHIAYPVSAISDAR